jgi:ABC-2 type transport system permease protein
MNTQSNAVPDSPRDSRINDSQINDSQGIPPASLSATRPLYWSMRRELWENRSIYIAPLIGAAVYLLGYAISLIWLPRIMRQWSELHHMDQRIKLAEPYAHAGMLITVIAFLVGIFYSLEALHGERRDRSILFWKSLPVSDLTTVLSKASVPLVVLPTLVFVITVAVQWIMFLLSNAVLLVSGASHATPWAPPVFEMEVVLLYSVIVIALWHAPVYMWLLLVSGWARRATFLWAVMPPLAIAVIEFIAFRTLHVGSLLQDRLFGFAAGAFDLKDKNGVPIDAHFIPLAQLAPGRFLSSPGLWIGLILAAIFLAAAVRLRRYQGPI